MLKRQRPATPPFASLGDIPSFLPDGPIRPQLPLHTADASQPCPKRQRTQPPPLDGALRGWLASRPIGPHWESDGEEDWIEDPHVELELPLLAAASQYKDANVLLHELHVLNQHRLLFAHPLRDRPLNPSARLPLLTVHAHAQDPSVGHRPAPWTDGSSYHPTLSRLTCDGLAGRSCSIEPVEDKSLVEEVHCVRQRYEDTNRLLGSLFLSRRREVEGTTPPRPQWMT